MTLFLLSIWCVGREFIDIIDSIRRLSLSIHWRFHGLQWLCFRRRFMDHPWHSVFDNSMSMLWLHFCYRFDASFVNSLTLSILYVHCHSIFINNFKFNMDSVFADDLWISSHIAFFYNSMSLPWLYFFYRFDASFVNSLTLSIPYVGCHSVFIDNFKVYSDSVFADNLWISRDITFLKIPCVSHNSIFAIDLMRHSWIHWRCRFHTSAVTLYSLTISRSTVTLFSQTIYGSAVT